MLSWIELTFDPTWIVICTFISVFLMEKIGLAWRIKLLFGLKISKEYKLIDCLPCVTFWLTLFITFNPISAMSAWLLAIIIERK